MPTSPTKVAGAAETSDRSRSPADPNFQWVEHSNALQATVKTLRSLIGDPKDGMMSSKEIQGMIRDASSRYMTNMLGPSIASVGVLSQPQG